MQSVGQLLANKQQPADFISLTKTRNFQNEEQSSNSENVKNRKVIEMMFTKFAVAFRHLWLRDLQDDRFNDFAKKEWGKNLKQFSDSVIARVTDICEQQFEFPPTMAQFIGLCKNEVNRQYVKKKEPSSPSSPETAAYHLNKMKEILNRRR